MKGTLKSCDNHACHTQKSVGILNYLKARITQLTPYLVSVKSCSAVVECDGIDM